MRGNSNRNMLLVSSLRERGRCNVPIFFCSAQSESTNLTFWLPPFIVPLILVVGKHVTFLLIVV